MNENNSLEFERGVNQAIHDCIDTFHTYCKTSNNIDELIAFMNSYLKKEAAESSMRIEHILSEMNSLNVQMKRETDKCHMNHQSAHQNIGNRKNL